MNSREAEILMKQIETMKKSANDLRDRLLSMSKDEDPNLTINYDVSREFSTTSKHRILEQLDHRVVYVESILNSYSPQNIRLQTPESAQLGLSMLSDQFNADVAEPCKLIGIPVERWGEQEKIKDLINLLKVTSDGISRKTGHDNPIRRCILDGEKSQETPEDIFVNIVTQATNTAGKDTQKMFSLTSGDEYRNLCKDLIPLTKDTKMVTLDKVSRKIENDFQEAAQRSTLKRSL